MNEKQRKAAIIVASILGCGALFYLGGLLGQVFTNYTIWMESGGMWGQTQIAAPDWNPAVCLLNAFSWNGVKAIFLIVVIGAGIVIYVKVHEKFSQNQYEQMLVIIRGQNLLLLNKFDYTRHPMSKEMVRASIMDYCPRTSYAPTPQTGSENEPDKKPQRESRGRKLSRSDTPPVEF